MFKQTKKIALTVAALAALALGGSALAQAGSSPTATPAPATSTVTETTTGADNDSVQSGDQSAPDTAGAEAPGRWHRGARRGRDIRLGGARQRWPQRPCRRARQCQRGPSGRRSGVGIRAGGRLLRPPTCARSCPMRVLIVEDHAKLADQLRRALRGAGMATDTCSSGEDALWMAGSTPYDARRARRHAAGHRWLRDLPPIARGQRPHACLDVDGARRSRGPRRGPRHRCRRLPDEAVRARGADRPAASDRATRRSSARPRSRGRRTPPRPRRANRSARDGSEIELSNKEFALLETFMRNPGIVLSRLTCSRAPGTTATRTAPMSSTSTSPDCANVSMRRSGPDTIQTIRGVGYRLRDDRVS